MRLHTTIGYVEAKAAHVAAWSAYEAIVDTGDEESPEAVSASELEEKLLDAFICRPAVTPTEVAGKLNYMRERDIDISWAEVRSRNLEQIERDLIELQRPCVSPSVAQAFAAWNGAYLTLCNHAGGDEEGNRLCRVAAAAFQVMVEHPCTTPGDFMVKAFANHLDAHGPAGITGEPGRSLFELDAARIVDTIDGNSDVAYAKSLVRDIDECDLGRCLQAMGRVDFDAAAWITAAERAGMTMYVTYQRDGSPSFSIRMLDGETDARQRARFDRCQILLAGGLGIVSKERVAAVVDLILATRPELVIGAPDRAEVAA